MQKLIYPIKSEELSGIINNYVNGFESSFFTNDAKEVLKLILSQHSAEKIINSEDELISVFKEAAANNILDANRIGYALQTIHGLLSEEPT